MNLFVNICYWTLDSDYTLASYKKGVEYLIHDIAKHHLVNKYGYPEDIASLVYDPRFPIRGELLYLERNRDNQCCHQVCTMTWRRVCS